MFLISVEAVDANTATPRRLSYCKIIISGFNVLMSSMVSAINRMIMGNFVKNEIIAFVKTYI